MNNTKDDSDQNLAKKQKACKNHARLFQMIANERCRKGTTTNGKPYALHGKEIDESNWDTEHSDDPCKAASLKALEELEKCIALGR